MKILLIEGDADDLLLARSELSRLGHTVIAANNGTDGLERYRAEQPDIVITDVYLAGMDGFALTRAVQALAAPRWQPVLFLTAHHDDDLQVRALQEGIDAYMVKPVSAEALGARLDVLEHLLHTQQQAERRALMLEHCYQAEEEKNIARQLMQRFVHGAELDDSAVRHWIKSTASFGGDIVAVKRTPNGNIHALLADGTGHGLAASIIVAPVLAPFYRMTEKGFGIDAIARELNAKLRDFLPGDCFVAATLATVDLRERVVGVWNGGNPEAVLMDANGSRTFTRRHVPLGVLSDAEFDATIDRHAFTDGSQFFLYSDGLIEAENIKGETYGPERLAVTLAAVDGEHRFEALKASVTHHLGGSAVHDDISLLMVQCQCPTESPWLPASRATPTGIVGRGGWRSTLRLSAAEIRLIDAVPLLVGMVGQIEAGWSNADRLFIVLSELYNNAIDHGLLGLDSRLKMRPDGMDAYLTERHARLAALNRGEIELELERLIGPGMRLRVSCRDSGPGFDHPGFVAAADSELPFGRGLMLLRAICVDLSFNAAGNQVTAIIQLGDDGK